MILLNLQFDPDTIPGVHERLFVKIASNLLKAFEQGQSSRLIDDLIEQLNDQARDICYIQVKEELEEFILLVSEYPGSDEIPSPVKMADLYNSLNEIVFTLRQASKISEN